MFVRIVCDDCGREIKPWEWWGDYDGEIQCPDCDAKELREQAEASGEMEPVGE